jgi:hypothetical protein
MCACACACVCLPNARLVLQPEDAVDVETDSDAIITDVCRKAISSWLSELAFGCLLPGFGSAMKTAYAWLVLFAQAALHVFG